MRIDAPSRRAARACLLACVLAAPLTAQQAPESAISWLSDSISNRPAPTEPEAPATVMTETPITVMPLGQTRRDAVGLLSTSLTGLPPDAIAGSDPARLGALFA
ncbi:MAG: hypothetical protein WBA67_05440, partial [Jannaschia sp.]